MLYLFLAGVIKEFTHEVCAIMLGDLDINPSPLFFLFY